MKIVIDIPQKTYNHVFDNAGISNNDLRNILLGISKSVILPDGHGRIGDLDILEKEIDGGIKAGLMIEGYENYSNINDMDDCLECVKYAPTIIEADKENEKDEHMTADEFAELFTGRDKE